MSKSFRRAKARTNKKDLFFTLLITFGVLEVIFLALGFDFYSADDKMLSLRIFGYCQIAVVLGVTLMGGILCNIDYSNNKILTIPPLVIEDDKATLVYLDAKRPQIIHRDEVVSVDSYADRMRLVKKNQKLDFDYASYGRLTFILKSGKKVDCGLFENVSEARDEVAAWVNEGKEKEPIA